MCDDMLSTTKQCYAVGYNQWISLGLVKPEQERKRDRIEKNNTFRDNPFVLTSTALPS